MLRSSRRWSMGPAMMAIVWFFAAGITCAQTPEIVVQSGHTARVNALAADADRALVATASNDYTVRIWKIVPPSDGALLRVLAGHTGFVTDVVFNVNDPTQVASCARDRTIRLWNVTTGEHQSILLEDEPQTLAYRKNSNIIAVGYRTASEIRFIDANTGVETDRPIALSAPASKIAYGERGEVIYCGLTTGVVEAFDARTKQQVGAWTVGTTSVISVFESKGRLAAVSLDGGVLTKRGSSEPITHQLNTTVSAAAPSISQDTVLIATGDARLIRLAVTTGRQVVQRVDAKQIDAVVQAADGTTLLYGEVQAQQYAWWIGRPKAQQFTVQPTGAVQQAALAISPSGEFLAVGDDHGSLTVYSLRRPMTPLRYDDLGLRKIAAIAFTADGSALLVGGFGETSMVRIDTRSWEITASISGKRSISAICVLGPSGIYAVDERREELVRWVERDGKADLQVAYGNVSHGAVSHDGAFLVAASSSQVIILASETEHVVARSSVQLEDPIRSVAVASDGSSVLMGTLRGDLVEVDPTTGKVVREVPGLHAGAIVDIDIADGIVLTAGLDAEIRRWIVGTLRPADPPALSEHVGQLRSVDVSRDGTIIASCAADARIIVRRAEAMPRRSVIAPVGNEWIVFDDEGHYDASVHGPDVVRVVDGLEILPLERFHEQLYRPLFLTTTTNDTRDIDLAAAVAAAPKPPTVKIETPVFTGAVTDSMIDVQVEVTVPTAGSSVRLDVFANGKYLERRTHRTLSAGPSIITIRVPLAGGANQIRVVPADEVGAGTADVVNINRTVIEPPRAPKAYILAIGINTYRNPMYDLIYARNDAESMVETLKSSISRGMEIEVIELLDGAATRSGVLDALQRVQREARSDDAMIFYYAGHGAVLRPSEQAAEYCFALHGVADINDPQMLAREGLLGDTLRSYLMRIKAQRQAVIIDACYSGQMLASFSEADNAHYVSELQRSTGATVLASVLPNKKAKEVDQLQHGVFTFALLEGLKGAAQDRDGDVTLLSLLNYLAKSMPSLGQRYGIELQQPVIRFEGAARTLVLANVQG